MLQDVQVFSDVSFLFCTATMPSFAKREGFRCGIDDIENLLSNPESYFISARRVIYSFVNNLEPISINEITSRIHECGESVLIILNTKKMLYEYFRPVEMAGMRSSTFQRLCFRGTERSY